MLEIILPIDLLIFLLRPHSIINIFFMLEIILPNKETVNNFRERFVR
jgi:hypothetical protein